MPISDPIVRFIGTSIIAITGPLCTGILVKHSNWAFFHNIANITLDNYTKFFIISNNPILSVYFKV